MMKSMSVVASLFLLGCSEVNKDLGVKDDNKGEQFLEEMIMDKLGIEVEFTPSNPEAK